MKVLGIGSVTEMELILELSLVAVLFFVLPRVMKTLCERSRKAHEASEEAGRCILFL